MSDIVIIATVFGCIIAALGAILTIISFRTSKDIKTICKDTKIIVKNTETIIRDMKTHTRQLHGEHEDIFAIGKQILDAVASK